MYTKYIFTPAILFLFGLNITNAQVGKSTISASLKFSSQTQEISNMDLNKSTVTITPRYSYEINNKIGIGAYYSYVSGKSSDLLTIDLGNVNTPAQFDTKTTGNAGGGFFQYYVFKNHKIKAFSELEAGYGKTKTKSDGGNSSYTINPIDTKTFSTGINFGTRYNFYKDLGTELRLNNLINYTSVKVEDQENTTSNLNVLNNIFDNISIGISYSF